MSSSPSASLPSPDDPYQLDRHETMDKTLQEADNAVHYHDSENSNELGQTENMASSLLVKDSGCSQDKTTVDEMPDSSSELRIQPQCEPLKLNIGATASTKSISESDIKTTVSLAMQKNEASSTALRASNLHKQLFSAKQENSRNGGPNESTDHLVDMSPSVTSSPSLTAFSVGSPLGLHPDLLNELAEAGTSPAPLLTAMANGLASRNRSVSIESFKRRPHNLSPVLFPSKGTDIANTEKSQEKKSVLDTAYSSLIDLVSFLGVIEIDVDSTDFACVAQQHEIPLLDDSCVLPTRIAYQLDAKALDFEDLFAKRDDDNVYNEKATTENDGENIPQAEKPSKKRRMEPLPEGMDIFAFPSGCRLSATKKQPSVHSFVLTDADGERSYGYVATSYVALPPALVATVRAQIGGCLLQLSSRDPDVDPSAFSLPSQVFGPQSLVILSKKPYHMFFSSLLDVLVERYIEHPYRYGSIIESERSEEVICDNEGSENKETGEITPYSTSVNGTECYVQPLIGSNSNNELLGVKIPPNTPKRSASGGLGYNLPQTPTNSTKLDALSSLHLAQFAAAKHAASSGASKAAISPAVPPLSLGESPNLHLDSEDKNEDGKGNTPEIVQSTELINQDTFESVEKTSESTPSKPLDESTQELWWEKFDEETAALAYLMQPASPDLVYPPLFTSHLTGLPGAMHPDLPHYIMNVLAVLCYVNASKSQSAPSVVRPRTSSSASSVNLNDSEMSTRSDSGAESEPEGDSGPTIIEALCDSVEEADRQLPAPTKLQFTMSQFVLQPKELAEVPEPILRAFSRRLMLLRQKRSPPLAQWHDIDMSYLCKLLTPECITTIFDAILQETPVLLLCSAPEALLHIGEALLLLLTPLVYSFAYIPLLPLCLADFLEAPQPFLVGSLPAMRSHAPAHALIVDVDASQITFPKVLFNPSVNDVEVQNGQTTPCPVDVGIGSNNGDFAAVASAAANHSGRWSGSDMRMDSFVSTATSASNLSGTSQSSMGTKNNTRDSASGIGLAYEAEYVEQPENTPMKLIMPAIYHVRLRHALEQTETARQQSAMKISAHLTEKSSAALQKQTKSDNSDSKFTYNAEDDVIYGDISILNDVDEEDSSGDGINKTETPVIGAAKSIGESKIVDLEQDVIVKFPSSFASAENLFASAATSSSAKLESVSNQSDAQSTSQSGKSSLLSSFKRRGAAPSPSTTSARKRAGRQTLLTLNSLRSSVVGNITRANFNELGLDGPFSAEGTTGNEPTKASLDYQHHALELSKAFNSLRMAFLDTFVSLFRGYRSFLRPPQSVDINGRRDSTSNGSISSSFEMDVEKWFNRDMFITQSSSESHNFLRFFTKSQMFMRFLTDRVTLTKVDWFDQRMLHALEESSRTLMEDATATVTCPAYMHVKGLIFDKWELCTLEIEHMSLLWTRREKDRAGAIENVSCGKVFLKEHLTSLTLIDEISAKRTNRPTEFPLCITVYPNVQTTPMSNAGSSKAAIQKPEMNVFYFKDSYTRRRAIQLITARTAQHHRQIYATFLDDERVRTRALREAAKVQARKNRRAYATYRHSIHRASIVGMANLLTPGNQRKSLIPSSTTAIQSRKTRMSLLDSPLIAQASAADICASTSLLAPVGEVNEGSAASAAASVLSRGERTLMISPFSVDISESELARARRIESISYSSSSSSSSADKLDKGQQETVNRRSSVTLMDPDISQMTVGSPNTQSKLEGALQTYLANLDGDIPKPPPSPFNLQTSHSNHVTVVSPSASIKQLLPRTFSPISPRAEDAEGDTHSLLNPTK